MRRDRELAVGALALLALAGCRADPLESVPDETSSSVLEGARELDPPARPGAFAPELWADESGLLLTWLEPLGDERQDGHRLRISELDGERWREPVTIAEGNDFFANWADVPAAARSAEGTLYAHWLAKTGEETYAYSIFLARSTDGTSWEPRGRLNDDSTDTEHGFVSWVREGDGLRAFWLDGRAMIDDLPMSIRTAVVARDGVGPVELLDDRVCECCSTDAAVSSVGPYVVYRDRSEREVRDVSAVGRRGDGWSEPRPVSAGGWTIEGCPVNGPETDADGDLAVAAWFTAVDDRAQVRAAFSRDGGASFESPIVIDANGPLGRVDTILDGEGAVLTWLSATTEGRAELKVVRVSEAGVEEPRTVAETSAARASGFPRIVRQGDQAYLAWVELEPDSPSRLRFIRLGLSAL